MTKTILVKPIVNEKANAMAAQSKYAFVVHKNANKIEVKQAVEQKYNVTVTDVQTLIMPAEARSLMRSGRMVAGRIPGYKKAYVTLQLGDSINFFPEQNDDSES